MRYHLTTLVISTLFFITSSVAEPHQHTHGTNNEAPQANTSSGAITYHANGTVKNWTADSVSITHQPIPELHWPTMTMSFTLSGSALASSIPTGSQVNFSFVQTDSGYQITQLTPIQ